MFRKLIMLVGISFGVLAIIRTLEERYRPLELEERQEDDGPFNGHARDRAVE